MLSMIVGVAVAGGMSIVALILAHPLMEVVTDDPRVQAPAVAILPAVMLNLVASLLVSIGTSGIITSQGRTKVVTFLTMGFELPLTIGSTAVLVLYFKAGLTTVYWAQAIVSGFEAVVVLMIIKRSNWDQFARDAVQRQKEAEEAPQEQPVPHEVSMQENLPVASDASEVSEQAPAEAKGKKDGTSDSPAVGA